MHEIAMEIVEENNKHIRILIGIFLSFIILDSSKNSDELIEKVENLTKSNEELNSKMNELYDQRRKLMKENDTKMKDYHQKIVDFIQTKKIERKKDLYDNN